MGFVVFCSVKLRRLNRDIAAEFTRIIQDIPEVTECYNISGSYDYLLNQKSKVYDEEWQKDPGNGPAHARFLFDEVHGLLNRQVNPGDRISVVRTGSEGHVYGIDFVELEQALPEIQRPDNSVSITDDDLTVTEEERTGCLGNS